MLTAYLLLLRIYFGLYHFLIEPDSVWADIRKCGPVGLVHAMTPKKTPSPEAASSFSGLSFEIGARFWRLGGKPDRGKPQSIDAFFHFLNAPPEPRARSTKKPRTGIVPASAVD